MGSPEEAVMATEVYLLIGLLVIATAYVAVKVHEVIKFRGRMLVTCPETRKPAAVKVGLWRAIRTSLFGKAHVELCECTRWPEAAKCEQDCLFQVERYPEDHRVWNVAKSWFEGKTCVYCGKPIQVLSHTNQFPALLNAEKKTILWDELPPEKLPEAFASCKPVCGNCHTIESLIREQPERVTFRPWERSGPMGEYTPVDVDKEHEEKVETHVS
jgi:hypothetical protein